MIPKSMKYIYLIFIPILIMANIDSINSQTPGIEINKIDNYGFKQGVWVKSITPNIIDTMNYSNDTLNGIYKSYFLESGGLRHIGHYLNGCRIGTWKFYDKGKLVAEEIQRGLNTDTIKNEYGTKLVPKYYSYIKLYDSKKGYLKSEGKVIYNDSWDSDMSNEHGIWYYFNPVGDTISQKDFYFGKAINK